jgi:2-dehydropantoate 2-reductase
MRIAVVGLGGVGGYFGGKVALKHARSGEHWVGFIARGAHLAAIRRDGLLLKTVEGEDRILPDLATDDPAAAGTCDLVLFCVKEYALEEAAAAMTPLLSSGTLVLPLLNGVDISERLRARLPRGTVLSGCVYISSCIEAPGTVRQTGGTCQLFFGPDDGRTEPFGPLAALLAGAGIKAALTDRIGEQLWSKYLFVSPMAGVTSLAAQPFGAVMADERLGAMVRGLMEEIVLLARARGIDLPAGSVEAALAKVALFPYETKSSLQLDYAKGGRSEIDLFIGCAVRAGRAAGVPVPLHEALYEALLQGPRA